MDWRQDAVMATMNSSHSNDGLNVPFDLSARLLNFVHSNWAQALQQLVDGVPIEMRIGRFNADEKSIPACQGKPRFVEQRMVRHRQPVESKHSQCCEQCSHQN